MMTEYRACACLLSARINRCHFFIQRTIFLFIFSVVFVYIECDFSNKIMHCTQRWCVS